jgi:hypothetical protein
MFHEMDGIIGFYAHSTRADLAFIFSVGGALCVTAVFDGCTLFGNVIG